MSEPWYAWKPCAACLRPIGANGVFVTLEARWCRSCAVTVRDVIAHGLARGEGTMKGQRGIH